MKLKQLTAITQNLLLVTVAVLAAPASAATDAGQALLESKCTLCHDLPVPQALTSSEWREMVNTMAPNAGLSDSEKTQLLDYLEPLAKKL